MNLLPDSEQTQLLDAAIDFLGKEAPVNGGETVSAYRARMGRPFLEKVAGLGWIGLGLSEDLGGVGYTLAEEALFFREYGRHLLTPAVLGAVLGARLAAEAGAADTAAAIVGGEALVAVAFGKGDHAYVLEFEGADFVLEAGPERASLYPAAAVQATNVACLDDRLNMARGRPSGAALAELRGEAAARLYDRGATLCAAMLAGMAEASRDVSVEYAKTRKQFGQPIGSFQAIAHKCVDMLHSVEFSRASARYAAAAEAEGDAEFPVAARVAAAYCGEAFRTVTVETVQVHGGTGFTWEHDTHLYYRRAWSSQQLLAGRDDHYAAIADRVGL
jgi:alkylation response protein AidB-like acyl-CoA dehydrogenase